MSKKIGASNNPISTSSISHPKSEDLIIKINKLKIQQDLLNIEFQPLEKATTKFLPIFPALVSHEKRQELFFKTLDVLYFIFMPLFTLIILFGAANLPIILIYGALMSCSLIAFAIALLFSCGIVICSVLSVLFIFLKAKDIKKYLTTFNHPFVFKEKLTNLISREDPSYDVKNKLKNIKILLDRNPWLTLSPAQKYALRTLNLFTCSINKITDSINEMQNELFIEKIFNKIDGDGPKIDQYNDNKWDDNISTVGKDLAPIIWQESLTEENPEIPPKEVKEQTSVAYLLDQAIKLFEK
jgi:hypothetical protein